jgi:hypothetical protein
VDNERRQGLHALRLFARFWLTYYIYRKQDCDSLTYSTGMEVVLWESVCKLLLDTNARLETSIAHYLACEVALV